jgi:hypothetical protein
MSSQTHIIRRQVLDVDVAGTESDGLALQRRLPGLLHESLLPALEAVLDRLVTGDEHWTIDRLEIDVGSWRPEALERGFVDAVAEGVGRYLHEHAPRSSARRQTTEGERSPRTTGNGAAGIERRSRAQSLRLAFRYFLETGILPWWFSVPQGRTLEDLIHESWGTQVPDGLPLHFAAVLTDAMGTAAVWTRLVRQFSPRFLETLLGGIAPESVAAVRDALERIAVAGLAADALERASEQVWHAAFYMTMSGGRPTADTLIAVARGEASSGGDAQLAPAVQVPERAPHNRDAGESSGSSRSTPRVETPISQGIDLDEGVHVNCAGIVLLHPFLPRLFEAVGIAADDALLQPERAMCLMHFLATGQRVAPEYDLLLAKRLCNVPLDVPVTARIELTAAEEEEAEALLAAVIGHWDALRDTSADGLRGTFLVRPGKLSRRWDQDVLQVDTQTVDILLDRLPWGISVIQLPWMEQRLSVEWRL